MTRVDELYASFCDSLPGSLREGARALPFRLGLAPAAGVGFGDVFRHEVTLEAPRLLAQGLPGCPGTLLEHAELAHLLAVVEAFGADRIEDGQVAADATLRGILDHLHEARDAALAALGGEGALRRARAADSMTRDAIAAERSLLSRGHAVSLSTYLDVSRRKQAVGIVASKVLYLAAGVPDALALDAEQCLLGIALGLQLMDDVVDWEDDRERGGSWAALLAPHLPPGPEPLARLASEQVQSSSRSALSLGALGLSRWAAGQAEEWSQLASAEARGPGYIGRKQKLAAWAAEVLG